ncbi:hypothetical protein BJV82DRAFT_577860 [Fennellomyces sp. T-0311]|nr:hypothetical protein BJV82DRAFT_577860 [Fennellomyces sp. T-0311]
MTVTLYLSTEPMNPLLEGLFVPFESTKDIPVSFYRHWSIVYAHDESCYVIESYRYGIHYGHCNRRKEDDLRVLFKLEVQIETLRRKLESHFQGEEYDVCFNNCQHFAMRVIHWVHRVYKLPVGYCNQSPLLRCVLSSYDKSQKKDLIVSVNWDPKLKKKLLACVIFVLVLAL